MSARKETAEPGIGENDAGVAAAAAVALSSATRREKASPEAAGFLVAHKRLAELQMEHLHEERALHHRHLALKYFGDRLRIGLELLAVIFGLIVVIGLGALIWRAHNDHGLVVEALSVPPDLAQRGLTGQVVASRLLDKLADMQAQTASLRPASTYANNWGSDLKVQIPSTGVSIGEAERVLTDWLGHETHISGEIFRTPAGLAVAARTEGAEARTFDGPDADLDRLLQKAAESVYGATQPYRYAVFLDEHGRGAEARPLLERLAHVGSAVDRYSAAMYLTKEATYSGDPTSDLAMIKLAIQAEPNSSDAHLRRENWETVLGHWEAGLADANTAVELSSRFQDPWANPDLRGFDIAYAKEEAAYWVGNFRAAARIDESIRQSMARIERGEVGADISGFVASQALDLTHNHETTAARRLVATEGLSETPGSGLLSPGPGAIMRLERERTAEDWPAVISEAPARLSAAGKGARPPFDLTNLAYGLARGGRLAEAEAIEARTPLDCYPCIVDRGSIAAMKRDWPRAWRWFAEAVRQGPSLPFAHLEWGRMLLAQGDVAGAIHQLDLAHQKGPHFADPVELWGEALMRQKDYAGAAAKFEAADPDAPRWGRNHMLWGQALSTLGKADEARAQFRAARGMDLSAADRAVLERLLMGA